MATVCGIVAPVVSCAGAAVLGAAAVGMVTGEFVGCATTVSCKPAVASTVGAAGAVVVMFDVVVKVVAAGVVCAGVPAAFA